MTADSNGNLLSVTNLRTYFETEDGTVKAVDGISFELKRGETLGIVGESGSGKSVANLSLMRLIPDPPGKIVSGSIMFDGRDVLTLSNREVRNLRGKRIAMIFQDPMTSLNPFHAGLKAIDGSDATSSGAHKETGARTCDQDAGTRGYS